MHSTPFQEPVQQLLNKWLKPPSGKSSATIREKLLFWIDRANHPEKYIHDKTKQTIAEVRRKARQNLRRLIVEHPEVATAFDKEWSQAQAEVA